MTTPVEATTAMAAETDQTLFPTFPISSPRPLPTITGPRGGGGGDSGAAVVDVPKLFVWGAAAVAGAVGVGMVWL